MSLVIELQQLAWDQKNDLSDLLRKAYLVAFKLNLRSFKTWIECEMNGYMNKKMPPYRQIQGRVVCHNPYRGWIPFICKDNPRFQATLSSQHLNTPVGVLQEFLQHNKDGYTIIYYPPDIETFLMSRMNFPQRPALEVPRSAHVAILDKVRNTILNWSLRLEADGILGDGKTFTTQEKRTASEKEAELRPVVTVSVTNNVVAVGAMDGSAVQQSSPQGEVYFDPDSDEQQDGV